MTNKKLRYENPLIGARDADSRAVEKILENTRLIREALNQAIESKDSDGTKLMMIINNMHDQDRERDSMCMNVTSKVYADINDFAGHVNSELITIAADVQTLKDRSSLKQFWSSAKLVGEGARILITVVAAWAIIKGFGA